MKQTILKEYPRLTRKDRFKFLCHNRMSCFNQCCRDVTIFLTPYDIIRMKNRLGISSQEFLAKYTVSPFTKEQELPVVVLKMRDDMEKTCQFVEAQGCTIYEDRPWSCRMYPVGIASSKPDQDSPGEEFYFVMHEDVCNGLSESREWTIDEWIKDQKIESYDEIGNLFKEINLHSYLRAGKSLDPQKMEMYYMVCYNLDKFRTFLFESSFFDRFGVSQDVKELIEHDDLALLKFGFLWLKFSLFGEKTMKVKPDIIDKMKKGDVKTSK
ncbi:MAG: hypothetical protein A2161_21770 [Candidatus Schekmanbacteria bacterium RBG_13_48_7]|uniref:Fe-S oxidoreductase n=1 Tax=Candidatus Schekmanbacteria bacterium RBG_13_48_7 TaxID=1817878 RepID=A0A1F7RZ03_9BACT|nr:MAG: hypothetical protein A2161_21770 [Candidatus Schekmanbacteria bacterium RBG_13_48_7]